MLKPTFNIQLSSDEIKALAVFKPELQKVLDDWYVFNDKFISRLQDLCGFLKFLSVHNYTEHISKVETLLKLLNDYFFDTEVQKMMYSHNILGANYGSFISAIDSIYSDLDYVLDTFNAVSPYSDEYVKEYCSYYYNKIADLIKIGE